LKLIENGFCVRMEVSDEEAMRVIIGVAVN
jgi:hypothetical protein